MGVYKNRKFKILILIFSAVIAYILIFLYLEYSFEKKKENAMRYLYESYPMIKLANILGTDVECNDGKGNKWAIKTDEDMESVVYEYTLEYIQGERSNLVRYRIIENKNTNRYIGNFNANMENIRISGKDGGEKEIYPKTIADGEGLDRFTGCGDLNELIEYMGKKSKKGEYYIDILMTIGLDGSSFEGKIIYDIGNGNEKIIKEHGIMTLKELFTENYGVDKY